jgi:hypothetical protein
MSTTEHSDTPAEVSSTPTLHRLIYESLIARGFGGLFNDWGDCACRLGDLFPCGAPSEDCTAGYVHETAPGSEGFVVSANRIPRQEEGQGGAMCPEVDEEETE